MPKSPSLSVRLCEGERQPVVPAVSVCGTLRLAASRSGAEVRWLRRVLARRGLRSPLVTEEEVLRLQVACNPGIGERTR